MPESPKPAKTALPFSRAYDFLMADRDLLPAEKLVMFIVLRFHPKPCTMKKAAVARACGLKPDYVRNLIRWLCAGPAELRAMKRPPRRAYLREGQITAPDTGGKLIRWLVPLDFPGDESATINALGELQSATINALGELQSATINAPKRDCNRASATINALKRDYKRAGVPV